MTLRNDPRHSPCLKSCIQADKVEKIVLPSAGNPHNECKQIAEVLNSLIDSLTAAGLMKE